MAGSLLNLDQCWFALQIRISCTDSRPWKLGWNCMCLLFRSLGSCSFATEDENQGDCRVIYHNGTSSFRNVQDWANFNSLPISWAGLYLAPSVLCNEQTWDTSVTWGCYNCEENFKRGSWSVSSDRSSSIFIWEKSFVCLTGLDFPQRSNWNNRRITQTCAEH